MKGYKHEEICVDAVATVSAICYTPGFGRYMTVGTRPVRLVWAGGNNWKSVSPYIPPPTHSNPESTYYGIPTFYADDFNFENSFHSEAEPSHFHDQSSFASEGPTNSKSSTNTPECFATPPADAPPASTPHSVSLSLNFNADPSHTETSCRDVKVDTESWTGRNSFQMDDQATIRATYTEGLIREDEKESEEEEDFDAARYEAEEERMRRRKRSVLARGNRKKKDGGKKERMDKGRNVNMKEGMKTVEVKRVRQRVTIEESKKTGKTGKGKDEIEVHNKKRKRIKAKESIKEMTFKRTDYDNEMFGKEKDIKGHRKDSEKNIVKRNNDLIMKENKRERKKKRKLMKRKLKREKKLLLRGKEEAVKEQETYKTGQDDKKLTENSERVLEDNYFIASFMFH